jgi:hypothetical protein
MHRTPLVMDKAVVLSKPASHPCSLLRTAQIFPSLKTYELVLNKEIRASVPPGKGPLLPCGASFFSFNKVLLITPPCHQARKKLTVFFFFLTLSFPSNKVLSLFCNLCLCPVLCSGNTRTWSLLN